jgi:hypothetical protein
VCGIAIPAAKRAHRRRPRAGTHQHHLQRRHRDDSFNALALRNVTDDCGRARDVRIRA